MRCRTYVVWKPGCARLLQTFLYCSTEAEIKLQLHWHVRCTCPYLGENVLHYQRQKAFKFEHIQKLWGILSKKISNFSQCKQDPSFVLHNDWRNGSLRTLSLGFCPKEGFDLIYTLAIKVIYFLDSGNCCVDSERHWHLFLLVQAKCDSKRLKITQILDQRKHFTWQVKYLNQWSAPCRKRTISAPELETVRDK